LVRRCICISTNYVTRTVWKYMDLEDQFAKFRERCLIWGGFWNIGRK
jgi:hypothetical protein